MKTFTGIVLCGGRSSRIGRDKALIEFNGALLLERQIQTLRAAGADRIIVSGKPRPAVAAQYVPDEFPDRGPLGGLHAALKSVETGFCAVLAVDMPYVTPAVIQTLIRAADAPVTLARHASGIEPLCGIYRAELHKHIPPLITNRGVPVKVLCDISGFRTVFFSDDRIFVNLNTPEELLQLTDPNLHP